LARNKLLRETPLQSNIRVWRVGIREEPFAGDKRERRNTRFRGRSSFSHAARLLTFENREKQVNRGGGPDAHQSSLDAKKKQLRRERRGGGKRSLTHEKLVGSLQQRENTGSVIQGAVVSRSKKERLGRGGGEGKARESLRSTSALESPHSIIHRNLQKWSERGSPQKTRNDLRNLRREERVWRERCSIDQARR